MTEAYTPDDEPAFVIGVTGHMDPGDPAEIESLIRELFHFLRWGKGIRRRLAAVEELRAKLPELTSGQRAPEGNRAPDPEEVYDDFFKHWPGLERTPIVVLSSLAPGADQLVAKVALEPEFRRAGFKLRCPLPFPLELYRQSSSFVRKIPDDVSESEKADIQTANHRRQEDFDNIVSQLGEHDCFVVAIEDDLEMSQEALPQRYQDDLREATRRHRRYQGAGEYIAAHCHLMIAIWDHIDDSKASEGTAGIVHARRYGLTRGLLPTTREISLPAEGATLQIYTKRQKREALEKKVPTTRRPDPPWKVRWLFAYATREQLPKPYGESLDSADASWQQSGLSRFLRMTQLLVEFNLRLNVDGKKADDQLNRLLCDARKTNYRQRLEASSPLLFQMVKHLADFRRRAADEQRDNESCKAHSTLVWLFWLTLLAASVTHTHNHWHSQLHSLHAPAPAHHDSAHAPAATANELASNPAWAVPAHSVDERNQPAKHGHRASAAVTLTATSESLAERSGTHAQPDAMHTERPPAERTGDETRDAVITFLIGLGGLSLLALALLLFKRQRPQQRNEKSDDLRAIAEGARVQLVWSMAGVGESVPSSYMQRQLSELSWIRQAIQAVSMPYEQSRWLFDALDRDLQIGLLRCVFHTWIRGQGGAQADYFSASRKKFVAAIHFWHKTGCVLALAGLWLGVLYLLAAFFKIFGVQLFQWLSPPTWNGYVGVVLLLVLAVPAVGALWVIGTFARYASRAKKISKTPWKDGWEKARTERFDHLVERWIPTEEVHAVAHAPEHFGNVMLANFGIYVTRGLIVAIFAVILGVCLAHASPLLPGLGNWIIIFSAWLLISGGLALAWPERRFYSELAYQYGTMQTLFSMAADRIEPMIDQLEELYRTNTDSRYAGVKASHYMLQLPADEQATFDRAAYAQRLQADAGADYVKLLRRIQLALYELGTESLDENAEWLILHRARPLEPVMAG